MTETAIIGASGYTGIELIRLLAHHPELHVACVTSRQYAGKKVSRVFPSLGGFTDLTFEAPDPKSVAAKASTAFTALPHETAMEFVPKLLAEGLKVVDLSADFRFRNAGVYAEWYHTHSSPELLAQAVYGLPELHKEDVRSAQLVGNPGCYPTSAILALAPLLKNRRVDVSTIIVDSKSGASGAGRAPAQGTVFCEVNESFKAYKVGQHRHTPEIEQELSFVAGAPVTITFTPHLTPMNRGILTTVYARILGDPTTEGLLEEMEAFYRDEPFIRVLPPESFPATSNVTGSNFCDLGLRVDGRTGRVVVVSAIDNLVKGASGQAVQNMNLMLGLEETAGLRLVPVFP